MKLPFLGTYKFPIYSYSRLAAQQVPADLPKHIYIKTPIQTFSRLYYFALRNGLIWIKPNEETTGISEPWELFPPIGLPTNDLGNVDFEEPERVMEITTDADELVARSSWNHFYFIRFDNKPSLVGDFWRDGEGVPPGRILLDQRYHRHRGFALGRRNQDVLYWEDPVGNPHHWGVDGISTLYVLSENGQEINIFDTGLPHDFSRQFGCPCRGRFIAESISASASTVFVIDKYGNMYTRLVDFDTIGSNSMFFKYTYHDKFRSNERGDDPKTAFKSIGLPAEDWRKQQQIILSGQARLSRGITILQTGQGNSARELRVAGIDADGNTGYYWKPIFGDVWDFQKTYEVLDESRFLLPEDLAQDKENLGTSQDIFFTGTITFGGQTLHAEVPNFNLFCNPSQLKIHCGEESLELNLFSLDMWTWTTRVDPGRDGTPRIYLAAIEISQPAQQIKDGELQELIKSCLYRRNLEPDAFVVRVSTNYFEMYSRHSKGQFFVSCVRPGSGYATPDEARIDELENVDGFLAQINQRSLIIDGLNTLKPNFGHIQYLKQKIKLNAYSLNRLIGIMKVRRFHNFLLKLLAATISVSNFLATITFITLLPKVGKLSRIVPTIVHAYADFSSLMLKASEHDFRKAQRVLVDRQSFYQSKLDALLKVFLPPDGEQ